MEDAMTTHNKYKHYIEDQKKFFDELITMDWDTYHDKFWDYTRKFEANVIIKQTSPKSILDVGCGCGFHDLIFAKNSCVEKVIGIDYSNESVKKANTVYPNSKVERFCVDFLADDELVANNFDLVVSFQVIEHLKNYEKFFRKMVSKANADGYIVVATPNYDRFSNRIRKFFSKKPQFCDPMHYEEFNLKKLKHLGEKMGLEMFHFLGYGCSLNVKFNLDKFVPKILRFYIGLLFPRIAEVLIVFFRKKYQ